MTTTITPSTPTLPYPTIAPIDNVDIRPRRPMTDVTHPAPPVVADRWRGAFSRSGRSRRRRTDRWMLNDPAQMLLTVWMDHLADGHSTTRMRSARGVARRPLTFG